MVQPAHEKCWAAASGRGNCSSKRLPIILQGYQHTNVSWLQEHRVSVLEHNLQYSDVAVDVIPGDPDQACITVTRSHAVARANNAMRRRTVLVKLSDAAVSHEERQALGPCTLVAASHSERSPRSSFVEGWDFAVPLAHGHATARAGSPPLPDLEALAAVPARARRYWLTFKGQIYPMVAARAGSRDLPSRLPLLRLQDLSRRAGIEDGRTVIAAKCMRWKPSTRNYTREELQSLSRADCDTKDRTFALAPSFLTLFNTTFSVVPGGMQPASYRLSEAMAAGSIPVLVHGNEEYVRPFSEALPWDGFSLSCKWKDLDGLVSRLKRLDDTMIDRMQRGVRQAWRERLRPGAATRTFYDLARTRLEASLQISARLPKALPAVRTYSVE